MRRHTTSRLGLLFLVTLTACDDSASGSDPAQSGGGSTVDDGVGGTAPEGGAAGGSAPELDLGPPEPDGAPFLDLGAGGGEVPVGGALPPPEGGEFTVETLHEERITLDRSGVSEDITFEVPDDAIAFTIFGIGSESADYYVVEHLENPEGEAFVSENPGTPPGPFDQFLSPWPGQFRSPNRAAPSESMATLLFPNNPELPISAGTWTLRVAGLDPNSGQPSQGEVLVTVRVKRAPKAPARGLLKLNLYFTGARGWTADTALEDDDFVAALDRMSAFYEAVGIDVVPVSFNDIDQDYATIDNFMGGADNELNEMFTLGETEEGVNLFFVERFGGQFGGAIGGIAGGIPGPSGAFLGGTSRSGVAVATNIDPNPGAIGHVMGHETGHYLGLFHTSEAAVPGVNDPIPDTAEGERGSTNLMFPTVTAGDATLSEQQGQIVRGNPTILPPEAAR